MLKIGELAPDDRLYRCTRCKNIHAMRAGEAASPCEICVENGKKQEWQPTHKEFIVKSRNIAREIEKQKTPLDKFSDSLTATFGTPYFLFFHIVWFAAWLAINSGFTPIPIFDPFPFGLLTTMVSLEAIFLSIFILISQNRASQINNLRSELDYQVDMKAEKRVTEILALLREQFPKK